jgi:hypothetical protein
VRQERIIRGARRTATRGAVPVRRRRRGRLGALQLVWALTVGLVVTVAVLSLSGTALRLPDWATERIGAAVNARLDGARLGIGRIELRFGPDGRPQATLGDVEVMDGAGNVLARLNSLGARLSPAALVEGRIVPRTLRLTGAQITLRRDAAGGLSVRTEGFGAGSAADTPGAAVALVDGLFERGILAGIERIAATDVTVTLEDARSGRLWQATGGTFALENGSEALSVTLVSEVFNGTEDLARIDLTYRSPRGSPAARLEARFENAGAADIAAQSPALALLELLDAPISGALRLEISPDGSLGPLSASLDIGAGRLRPAPAAQPVAFESARAVVDYDPARERIELRELSAESELLRLSAEGHLLPGPLEGGWPRDMVAQVRLRDVAVAPGAMLAGPLSFDAGAADLRVTLEPFAVEIGALALDGPHGRQRASGRIAAAPEGWRLAVDIAAEAAGMADVLALWPLPVTPAVRDWIAANVAGGTARDFAAAIRIAPGAPPVTGLSFAFEGAEVRVMPNLPPVTGAAGVATLHGTRFALALEAGRMQPPDGPAADLAGSTFVLPDLAARPRPAELHLAATGPAASILRLLDNPPFRVLERSGKAEALAAAEASATVAAEVRFPMKGALRPAEVSYVVTGALDGVAAEGLLPGRSLGAERLALRVTPAAVELSGPVLVDGLPLEATYRQPIADGAGGAAEVSARLSLTSGTLAQLGIDLPAGAVTGAAEGLLALDMGPDGMGFRLTSDLVGAGLRIPPLGWSKAPGSAGRLEVEGAVVEGTARIDRLALEAPGLLAEGRIEPGTGTIRLDRLRAGRWLDARVTLTPRGSGRAPAVTIEGGQANLALRPETQGGGGAGGPLRVTLDRLTIGGGLALAPFRADLTAERGLTGSFEGRVNGGAPVRGSLSPSGDGSAIRIAAADGGAVLRDAGLFRDARGGAMDLTLVPRGGAGRYDGQLVIAQTRVVDAPGLASLLNAISVVGLLTELQGSGIVFDTVEARFELSPERVILREGSAVGASLGISMDGVYDVASRQMDMQGVVSPIYLVNGIGQIFTRAGEGLFGFAYRMTGPRGAVRVSVNPLSILTPGMFREIFRRPLPARAP